MREIAQEPCDALRPFDGYDASLVEGFVKTHSGEIILGCEPVKVEMVEWRGGWIVMHVGKCGAVSHLCLSAKTSEEALHKRCFASPQISIESQHGIAR